MKSLKEIEKMGFEELLAAASDEVVEVPDGFMERMDETLRKVGALTEDEAFHNEGNTVRAAVNISPFRRKVVRFISAAAAVAIVAGVGFSLIENDPKDTFDDPQQAYAELEKAFGKISDGLARGVAMAEDSQRIIDKISEVFE